MGCQEECESVFNGEKRKRESYELSRPTTSILANEGVVRQRQLEDTTSNLQQQEMPVGWRC